MAEIDDNQLKVLQGAQVLLDKLLKSPKTRRQAEKLIKEHYPETQTTDDLAAPYVERLDKLEAMLTERFKKEEDNQAERQFENQLQQLRDRGYTDEGLDKIKKLMKDKTIPDAIVAADHYEKLNPPVQQQPSMLSPSDWGFGRKTDDKDMTLLFKDEDAWAEKEARLAWDEEVRKKGQILT